MSESEYARLIAVVEAQLQRDWLLGARDLAIVRTLGDAGLRCEELATRERRDFLPARKSSKVRVLHMRFGKGDRQRRVRLTPSAARGSSPESASGRSRPSRRRRTRRCSSRSAGAAATGPIRARVAAAGSRW